MIRGALAPVKHVAEFAYDFAKHGGAVGTIEIAPDLPVNAIVTTGMIHVETAATSGGAATIAFHLNDAEDILAATAVGSFTLNALLDVVPVGTAATAVRTTALTKLSMVIADAALTAGRIVVRLDYYLG